MTKKEDEYYVLTNLLNYHLMVSGALCWLCTWRFCLLCWSDRPLKRFGFRHSNTRWVLSSSSKTPTIMKYFLMFSLAFSKASLLPIVLHTSESPQKYGIWESALKLLINSWANLLILPEKLEHPCQYSFVLTFFMVQQNTVIDILWSVFSSKGKTLTA